MKFFLILVMFLFSSKSLLANDLETAFDKLNQVIASLEDEFRVVIPTLVNPYYVVKPEILINFSIVPDENNTVQSLAIYVILSFQDENLQPVTRKLFSLDILKLFKNSFKEMEIVESQLYARILYGRKGVYDFLANHRKLLSKNFKDFLPAPYLEEVGLTKDKILERIRGFKNSESFYSQEDFQKSVVKIGEYFYFVLKNHIHETLSPDHPNTYSFSLAAIDPLDEKQINSLKKYYGEEQMFDLSFMYWIESSAPKDFYLSVEFLLTEAEKHGIEKSADPLSEIVQIYMDQFNRLVTEDLEALKNFGILDVLKKNHSKSSACGQIFENQ